MKKVLLPLLLLASIPVALAQTPGAGNDKGTEIVVDRASSDIFPDSWLRPEINAQAEPLSPGEQEHGRELAGRALAKYPPALLKANLKRIYMLKRLSYSGVSAGGTNSREMVYAIIKDKISDAKLEEIIHAEFSSILFRNHPTDFNTIAWTKINSPDFQYRGNGVQAIRNQQASERSSDALQEEGFYNEYGKASIEEDFNSFAGRLWVGDAGLWKAIEKYPKIKAKADLVIAFYRKLDPSLTPQFFTALRQPEVTNPTVKTTATKN